MEASLENLRDSEVVRVWNQENAQSGFMPLAHWLRIEEFMKTGKGSADGSIMQFNVMLDSSRDSETNWMRMLVAYEPGTSPKWQASRLAKSFEAFSEERKFTNEAIKEMAEIFGFVPPTTIGAFMANSNEIFTPPKRMEGVTVFAGGLEVHNVPFYGSTEHTKKLAEEYNKMRAFRNTVDEVNFSPVIDQVLWMRRHTQVVPVSFRLANGWEMTQAAEVMLKIVHSLNKATPVLGFLVHCAWIELQGGDRGVFSYPHVSIHQADEAKRIVDFLLNAYDLTSFTP